MISGFVARTWCLMEISSRPEIINIVTDPSIETTKIGLYNVLLDVPLLRLYFVDLYYFNNTYWSISGMEARFNCCKEMHRSLTLSSRVSDDPAFAGIAAKV